MRRAALLGLVAVCGACSTTSAAPPHPPSPATTSAVADVPAVPGIEAEAVRLRTDVPAGDRLQVRVTATGEQPFTVTSVAIDSPAFTPLPAAAVTAGFTPGRTIDLPTRFGPAVCPPGGGGAAALLTVLRPDGAVEEVRVPLTGRVLAEISDAACAVAGVLDVVRVEAAGLVLAGDAVEGDLVLARTGEDDRPLALTGPAGSVVFDLSTDGGEQELAAGEAQLAVPLMVRVATCEPHVLAETKQPFAFPLRVSLDGADPVPVPLPLDDAQRDLLWQLVDRTCAEAP
jgi:hypothetical protein